MANENYNHSLPPLEPGTILKGGSHEYEILELTSNRGGFGRIYKARYFRLGIVAIKEFHVKEYEDTQWSRMHSWTMADTQSSIDFLKVKFAEEVKLLSLLYNDLKGNHVPRIIERIWTEQGRMFYAMSFVNGPTLKEAMDANGHGFAMPEETALGYIIQTAKVLHRAHEVGLLHADVSPNNIMKGYRNSAVLVDWGNARSYNNELTKNSIKNDYRATFQLFQDDVDEATERMLQNNDLFDEDMDITIGTNGYLAPTQFWGKPQADVYSLAATLFYLLTGKTPRPMYSNDSIDKAKRLMEERNVSTETIYAILHAMNVDEDQATKTIRDFLTELPKEALINTLLTT